MTDKPGSGGEPGRFWLSVLVPMYDVEAYIDETLASIMDQADAGVEIVICDDASPDRAAAIAQRYVDRDPARVRLIRHPQNRGISAARNTLVDAAAGEYLWFVDSDDRVLPGAIAAIAAVVRRDAPDLIGGDYCKRGLRKSSFAGPRSGVLRDRDAIAGGICASRKMYLWTRIARRSLWGTDLRFPEGRIFEDAAIIPRLALRARSYVHLGRPLVDYRVRPDSLLKGIRNSRLGFDLSSHNDLACALEGFAALLDSEPEPFARTRFGASHFIAMEFAKTLGRIKKARLPRDEGRALAAELRATMEASSPIPFEQLARDYLRAGRFIAWWQLRRGLAFGG